jgi:hypothetical protein
MMRINYKIKYKKLTINLGTKNMISEHMTSRLFFKNNKNFFKKYIGVLFDRKFRIDCFTSKSNLINPCKDP